MTRRLTMGILAAIACGTDGGTNDAGTQATTTSGDVAEASTTAADSTDETTASVASDESTTAAASTDASTTDASISGADETAGTTGGTVECAPPVTTSACDNPSSIIRGIATLAVADGPTTGNLLVLLNHEYLGGGATGGVPHTGVFYSGIDLAAGPMPFEIDMCSNGEMWSEENCEFVVHVALDLDADNEIDPGEPTGSATSLFLSCTGDSMCLDVTLDCVDGTSCVAFTDPPVCSCAGNGASCDSPIVAC
jgi:hypothetical protein